MSPQMCRMWTPKLKVSELHFFCSSLVKLMVFYALLSDIGVFLCFLDEELPIVTSSSIDPALLRRYNELFDVVTRARRDKKKKYVLSLRPYIWLLYFCFYFCKVHATYYLFAVIFLIF